MIDGYAPEGAPFDGDWPAFVPHLKSSGIRSDSLTRYRYHAQGKDEPFQPFNVASHCFGSSEKMKALS